MSPTRNSERGFTLAGLIVILTVMAIFIAYTVPKPQEVLEADKVIERFPLGVTGPEDVKVVKVRELFER